MFFTLSPPVSRFRLLAVRAGLGWLQMAAEVIVLCCGMWIFVFPLLRGPVRGVEIFEYAGTLIACASGFYSIGVLLATFLDDLWRMWGSMITLGTLFWLSKNTAIPDVLNVFRAMGAGSPLVAHTMPWAAMAFSLGLGAILFIAATKVVQTREY